MKTGVKMRTYFAAASECAAMHRAHRDRIGADAISVMLSRPRPEHRKFANYQREDIRDVCLNAISYAEQESAR